MLTKNGSLGSKKPGLHFESAAHEAFLQKPGCMKVSLARAECCSVHQMHRKWCQQALGMFEITLDPKKRCLPRMAHLELFYPKGGFVINEI